MKLPLSKRKVKLFPIQHIIENYIETVKFLKYLRFSQTQTLASFKKTIMVEAPAKKANLLFKYNSLIDFNSSLDKVLLFYGKPLIRNIHKENTDVETLIYKNKLRGINTKCSLTFHKDKLSIFNYVIENPNKKESKKIAHYLSCKYDYNICNSEVKLIDLNENILVIKANTNQISLNFFKKGILNTKIFHVYLPEEKYNNSNELAFNTLI